MPYSWSNHDLTLRLVELRHINVIIRNRNTEEYKRYNVFRRPGYEARLWGSMYRLSCWEYKDIWSLHFMIIKFALTTVRVCSCYTHMYTETSANGSKCHKAHNVLTILSFGQCPLWWSQQGRLLQAPSCSQMVMALGIWHASEEWREGRRGEGEGGEGVW